jgi:hypothetical protein
MFLIKTARYIGGQNTGGTLGCIQDGRPYIIGFNDIKMVTKVSRILSVPPVVRLERSISLDITYDVQEGLRELGVYDPVTNIVVDPEALLTIHKRIEEPPVNTAFMIEQMENEDFLSLAFEKNLGLIMPTYHYSETNHALVYKASVIDPPDDINIFKQGLANLGI